MARILESLGISERQVTIGVAWLGVGCAIGFRTYYIYRRQQRQIMEEQYQRNEQFRRVRLCADLPTINDRAEKTASGDNSVVWLCRAGWDDLGLQNEFGPVLLLRGNEQKETAVIAILEENCPAGKIRLNSVIRNNLRVHLGDVVGVMRFSNPNIAYGVRVHILPIDNSVRGLTGNLFQVFLRPYFSGGQRPVHVGDEFTINGAMRTVTFRVLETDPSPACIVASTTLIEWEGKPVRHEDKQKRPTGGSYDELGGVGTQLTDIRNIVERPLRYAKLFNAIGIPPPRGIFLHGPSGCGKSLLARSVANETGAFFFQVDGVDLMSFPTVDASLTVLSHAFQTCEKNAPAVLFIRGIDWIAPKLGKTQGELKRRLVSRLLSLMNGLRSCVIVIASASTVHAIDGQLRRVGRMREIFIGIADVDGQRAILRSYTRVMKLGADVDLNQIAMKCYAYGGVHLRALCSEAARKQVEENIIRFDLEALTVDAELLDSLSVSMRNFLSAMEKTCVTSVRRNPVTVNREALLQPIVNAADADAEHSSDQYDEAGSQDDVENVEADGEEPDDEEQDDEEQDDEEQDDEEQDDEEHDDVDDEEIYPPV